MHASLTLHRPYLLCMVGPSSKSQTLYMHIMSLVDSKHSYLLIFTKRLVVKNDMLPLLDDCGIHFRDLSTPVSDPMTKGKSAALQLQGRVSTTSTSTRSGARASPAWTGQHVQWMRASWSLICPYDLTVDQTSYTLVLHGTVCLDSRSRSGM
jgi:hypothetical protein